VAKSEKRPKHVPERTCVVCRQKKPKRDLTRIIRTAHGAVVIDLGGKKAGRGAYLCATRACWDSGLKSGRIGRALKTQISSDDRAQLVAYGESLVVGASESSEGT
jgi:predicted RNA-binding protein YlxR (DUF448 family)